MKLAAGLQSHTTAAAISSGSPKRPTGSCATIWRSSLFMRFHTPRRFTAITHSNSSSLISSNAAASEFTPALLNAASSRPCVLMAPWIIAST
jgi:hypothetical protein